MTSAPAPSPHERRRHRRTPLGIPVRLCLDQAVDPATVELVDVSASGCAFRAPGTEAPVQIGQNAAFGFVVADRGFCLARGRVVRLSPNGFAVAFDDKNPAFHGFLSDVSGPEL